MIVILLKVLIKKEVYIIEHTILYDCEIVILLIKSEGNNYYRANIT